jgi:hypothetical protein
MRYQFAYLAKPYKFIGCRNASFTVLSFSLDANGSLRPTQSLAVKSSGILFNRFLDTIQGIGGLVFQIANGIHS